MTATPAPIFSPLTWRIAGHEISRAQMDFLDCLSKTPLGSDLILCGSGALFGVHLPGLRFVKDLDFIVADRETFDLAEDLNVAGIPYHQEPDSSTVYYSRMVSVFREFRFAVEAFQHYGEQIATSEVGVFHCASGRTAKVRTISRQYAAYANLASLALRHRPIDYLSFWLVGTHAPSLIVSSAELLRLAPPLYSDFTPPRPFPVQLIIEKLKGLEPEWSGELARYVHPIPPYRQVASEVTDYFDTLGDALEAQDTKQHPTEARAAVGASCS